MQLGERWKNKHTNEIGVIKKITKRKDFGYEIYIEWEKPRDIKRLGHQIESELFIDDFSKVEDETVS